eukprot:gene12063-biopygen13965
MVVAEDLVIQVDDMRVNRLVLGRMLRLLGFEVIEAENGKAALQQFLSHQESLSCVVLDLQMPVLDGWETAKQLRGENALTRSAAGSAVQACCFMVIAFRPFCGFSCTRMGPRNEIALIQQSNQTTAGLSLLHRPHWPVEEAKEATPTPLQHGHPCTAQSWSRGPSPFECAAYSCLFCTLDICSRMVLLSPDRRQAVNTFRQGLFQATGKVWSLVTECRVD